MPMLMPIIRLTHTHTQAVFKNTVKVTFSVTIND